MSGCFAGVRADGGARGVDRRCDTCLGPMQPLVSVASLKREFDDWTLAFRLRLARAAMSVGG